MSPRTTHLAAVAMGAVVLIASGYAVFFGDRLLDGSEPKWKRCQDANGVRVRGIGGEVCVKREAIVPV